MLNSPFSSFTASLSSRHISLPAVQNGNMHRKKKEREKEDKKGINKTIDRKEITSSMVR